MKKNISINLFGTLYNIDEDAYNLLESYLQSMQRYFSRQEGGEEIADDIEHRVAELLWQKKEAGMEAVNIDVVKEIIATIGKAEEIGGEENADTTDDATQNTDEANGSPLNDSFSNFTREAGNFAREAGNYAKDAYDKGRKHMNTHHFYRCSDDKVVAGVCSGCVNYFEAGDPLTWRLAAVLGTVFLSWIGIGIIIPLAYIALALLAPVAQTPEDRLRMQGKEVNPENLTQQVMDDTQQDSTPTDRQSSLGGCLKAILLIFAIIFLIPLISALIGIILSLITIGGIGSAAIVGVLGSAPFYPELAGFIAVCKIPLIAMLACGLLVVGIPISGLFHLIRRKPIKVYSVVINITIWILAIIMGIACIVGTVYTWENHKRGHRTDSYSRDSSRELSSIGWKLTEYDNLDESITDNRTGYGNLPQYSIELNADDEDVNYTAVLEKKIYLEDGEYTMMSLTEGACPGLKYTLRYSDGDELKEVAIIPTDGGIHLRNLPFSEIQDNQMFENPDSTGWFNFSCEGEDWVMHQTNIPHVNSGTYTLIVEARDCMTDVKIRDVKVVSTNKEEEKTKTSK